MPQKFLRQLLREKNRVHSSETQQCFICTSAYGTISPDTGVIECEIRLPCNSKHTFGSACIATRLEQNNTCPMCRTELFPMSDYDSDDDGPSPLHNDPLAPAPRVRRTRLVDREAAEQHAAARRIETVRLGRAERISILVITHSTTLNFHAAVTRCALTIADQLDRSHSLGDRSDSAMAAAAIYVASYLRRSPIALERNCQLTDSTEGTVQAIYRRFYASVYREEPYHWEQIFNTPYGLPAGHPHAPPWPPLEREFHDGENSDDEFVQDIWSRLSTELNLQPAVLNLAKPLAHRLETWPHLSHMDPINLVSFCIWIASHMAHAPIHHTSISDVAGLTPEHLWFEYRWMYRDRAHLLDETMTEADLPPTPRIRDLPEFRRGSIDSNSSIGPE